jgi:glycosyltransferase involved in cell wall biosynthesis
MRVAFDFDAVAANRFSGFYAYGTGLLRGLNKLAGRPDALLVYSRRFEQEVGRLKGNYPGWVSLGPAPIRLRWLENIWRYSKHPLLQRFIGDFDIYHCLHHLMPPTAGKHRVLTVHDLRRYKLPELYKESKLWRFELAVARADFFIAVSRSTKKDLCQIFGIPQEKVDVIHLAADENLSPLTDIEKNRLRAKFGEMTKTSIDRFVITISSSDSRKNIERTIRAFKSIKKLLPKGTKLVVAGKPPRNLADEKLREAYLDEEVVWTGTIDNLYEWMSCADALIFASLYEGFGIPILEAFACGVPVITSNCSSMPEVAGDAAVLVNPYDEQAIAQAIVDICNSSKLRDRLILSGLERNQQFSWTTTAAKTLEVYRKIL